MSESKDGFMTDHDTETAAWLTCKHERLVDLGSGGVVCFDCGSDLTFWVYPFIEDKGFTYKKGD